MGYPRGAYPRTDKHRAITSNGLKKFYANGGMVWSKGKEFSTAHRLHLSLSHIGKASKQAQASICSNCHIEYYKKDGGSRSKKRKYCSVECYDKCRFITTEGRLKISQIHKGKKYRLGIPSSEKQKSIARINWTGKNNPNWNGGSTLLKRYVHYKNSDYKNWRKFVFERDNYTCQNCNKHGGFLHPHHLKSYTKFPEFRYEVSNGMTLCVPCHKQIHSKKESRGVPLLQ